MKLWRITTMSKKKKFKKLAEANIQVLKSGKIKVAKGQKINLKPFVQDSVDNTVISRLDGIISKEEVVIDTSDLRVDVTTNMTTDIKTAELVSRVSSPTISTIVITVNKKNDLDVFDLLDDTSLGIILRTSTLTSIYSDKNVKDKWVELNKDDSTSFTNVMYVPKIMVFVDPNTGKIRKTPYYINLLLVAVPSVKKMTDGVEELSDEDATARVIADICEAAIKCGAKDLIIDPYGYKLFKKDPHITAELWSQISTGQRFIEQFKSVIFSIDNEELFIIFSAKKIKDVLS